MTAGPASPRLVLARVAERAVAVTPAVAGVAGPRGRWSTRDGERTIDGVVVTAVAGDGAGGERYEVDLHLAVSWPPPAFDALARELRERIVAGAARQGLAGVVAAVAVSIEDVVSPLELARRNVEPGRGTP